MLRYGPPRVQLQSGSHGFARAANCRRNFFAGTPLRFRPESPFRVLCCAIRGSVAHSDSRPEGKAMRAVRLAEIDSGPRLFRFVTYRDNDHWLGGRDQATQVLSVTELVGEFRN
jgi:hypothetical protein